MRWLQHSRVLNLCVPASAQYLLNNFRERRIIIGMREDFQRSVLVITAQRRFETGEQPWHRVRERMVIWSKLGKLSALSATEFISTPQNDITKRSLTSD